MSSSNSQSQGTKDKRAASIRAACAIRGKLIRSPEWIAKQKAAQTGKVKTDETKVKVAESMRQRWADPVERAKRVAANQAGGKKRRKESYFTVHKRIREIEKGQCAAHVVGLDECIKPAQEWAVLHNAINAAVDSKNGLMYSPEISDYVPLCISCHRVYDKNAQKAWDRDYHGRATKQCKGEVHRASHKHTYKLTEADVLLIHARRAKGHPLSEIAASFGVSVPTISMVASGKRWGHLKPNI